MANEYLNGAKDSQQFSRLRVLRHSHICDKLQVSSAKLFDMCAKGIFPKPFLLIPGGRAVGWLEHEVDAWITERSQVARGVNA